MTIENLNNSSKKFDILYKSLIIFSIVWVVVLVTLSRSSINTIRDAQHIIQQDIITIKDKAFIRYTNQVQINEDIQIQLDNK